MSGGHWGYQSERLRENADDLRRLFLTLAEVEEALDWGICGDWTTAESKEVVYRLMVDYFDGKMPRQRWDVLEDVRLTMTLPGCAALPTIGNQARGEGRDKCL